jgi:LacI family transcriptional regulator
VKVVSPKSELSIGVHVPASIDLCRRILTGVRSACEANGLQMHLISDTGGVHELSEVAISKIPPLAGIVAHICGPQEFCILRRISPHVVGTSNRGSAVEQPRIINDEAAIGRMGAEYLISLGLRRLVVLNKRSMRYSNERRDAFLAAAREAGAKAECIDFSRTELLGEVAESLMRIPPPVGLMAESDYSARALIERLPDYRKVVPHRIAVLGVDDDSLQNALSPISLSSVRTGGHEIGLRAAEWVLRLQAGEAVPEEPLRVRPIRVVERASTNVLAVEDPLVARTIRLLRERIGDFKDVKDVVESVGVNRRTLEIRFRKALNRSIASELAHARLRSAGHLLESTDLTIAEIAELVGYPEYRLLTLAFRRLTGEPPTAYRKRVRDG